MRVYVEIAGFWTPEYLRRKVAKLKEIKDRELIVLADEKTSCEAFREVPGRDLLRPQGAAEAGHPPAERDRADILGGRGDRSWNRLACSSKGT